MVPGDNVVADDARAFAITWWLMMPVGVGVGVGVGVVADDARAFAITRTQQHQTTPSRNTPP